MIAAPFGGVFCNPLPSPHRSECTNCAVGEQCGVLMHGRALTFCEPVGERELVKSIFEQHFTSTPNTQLNKSCDDSIFCCLSFSLFDFLSDVLPRSQVTVPLNTSTASVLQFALGEFTQIIVELIFCIILKGFIFKNSMTLRLLLTLFPSSPITIINHS